MTEPGRRGRRTRPFPSSCSPSRRFPAGPRAPRDPPPGSRAQRLRRRGSAEADRSARATERRALRHPVSWRLSWGAVVRRRGAQADHNCASQCWKCGPAASRWGGKGAGRAAPAPEGCTRSMPLQQGGSAEIRTPSTTRVRRRKQATTAGAVSWTFMTTCDPVLCRRPHWSRPLISSPGATVAERPSASSAAAGL